MTQDNIITGIDIGTSKVAVVIGTINEGVLSVMGLASVVHHGMRKGIVIDLEETVSSISHALEEAERMAGINVTHAYLSISGSHIISQPAQGVIAVGRASGEIQQDDIDRVIDAAKTVALPQNRELIHTFAHHFIVDGQDEIRDPAGMTGIRLEVQALVVSGATAAIRNLTRAVEQAGINIDGLIFAPLATAKAITTKKQLDSCVIVVDIGACTTSYAVYEEGELLYCGCLPIGSLHITNDIAIGLRTNLDVADTLKLKYGTVLTDKIRDSETINLAVIDPAEDERVSRKEVAVIIKARVEEIFQMLKEELSKTGKEGKLTAGVIFTGGGSEIEGLTELARDSLRLPATIGYPTAQISGLLDKIDNPIYSCCVGLVLWAVDENKQTHAPWRVDVGKIGGVWDKVRKIFQHFAR